MRCKGFVGSVRVGEVGHNRTLDRSNLSLDRSVISNSMNCVEY